VYSEPVRLLTLNSFNELFHCIEISAFGLTVDVKPIPELLLLSTPTFNLVPIVTLPSTLSEFLRSQS